MTLFAARICAILTLICFRATSSGLAKESAKFDLQTATIADISRAMNQGALSSEQLVTLSLARITAYGPQFTDTKLLGLGYAFEQATHALRQPVTTPALAGERFGY